MIKPSERIVPPYVCDAGRSRAIHDTLGPLLGEVRGAVGADFGVAVYRPVDPSATPRVLAHSATTPADALLPNEPLLLSRPVFRRQPALLTDVRIDSAVRDFHVRLSSAVAVPWRDQFGAGVLLLGNAARALPPSAADLPARRRDAASAVRALRRAREEGSTRLWGDLHHALRCVAESTASSENAGAALAAILAAARDLFGSQVAYLSIPGHDEETFVFDQTLDIRTSEFRHLEISLGQGLGGMARALGRPVRSLDYAHDDRLRAAPVAETALEGIVSAMAAPLVVDERIRGVIYVGNRYLCPFSETDESLLTEFAGYAALGLKRRMVDEYRTGVIQRQEREQLAYEVHDSVVRGLLQIGFEAEQAGQASQDAGLRKRMAVIGLAAEQCMEMLRGQLSLMTGDRSHGQPSSSDEVLEQMLTVQRGHGVVRTSEITGSRRNAAVPAPVARALVRVGQEALINAEIHSGCRQEHVVLDVGDRASTLTVADDGGGLDPTALDQVLAPGSPHLGFRAMRAAAAQVGGTLAVEAAPQGGLLVRAVIPHDRGCT